MTQIRLLYVTTKDSTEAKALAQTLLKRRLIACANILPAMQSVYRWQDKIEEAHECVLILKTTQDQVEAATTAILERHSYETPCVLTLNVESGSKGYLDWLKGEV
jgi:periplasmic divalent cation tolerance protein